ncbi:MAG: hypothetical protein ABFD46_01670 [Armatimonadota bacterium]
MDRMVRMTVYFIDGTNLIVEYPKQAGNDAMTIAASVKKALETDRLALEVDGDLMMIPGQNVKYLRLSPGPDELPEGKVLRGARIIG